MAGNPIQRRPSEQLKRGKARNASSVKKSAKLATGRKPAPEARTVLGKRLFAIRQRILDSGARLLSADEVAREARRRRGESGADA
jgi:hypothetical protein